MLRRTAAGLLFIATACGGPPAPRPSHPASPEPAASPPDGGLTEPFRTIDPKAPVPQYAVRSLDGTKLTSADWLGKRPLVLVFFTSWCEVCKMKLPVVKRALAKAKGPYQVIGVPIDDADTWDAVPQFIDDHGLDFPIVRGAQYSEFTRAYDPFDQIPVVIVVGRDGYVVEVQLGFSPNDFARLLAAIDLGQEEKTPLNPEYVNPNAKLGAKGPAVADPDVADDDEVLVDEQTDDDKTDDPKAVDDPTDDGAAKKPKPK